MFSVNLSVMIRYNEPSIHIHKNVIQYCREYLLILLLSDQCLACNMQIVLVPFDNVIIACNGSLVSYFIANFMLCVCILIVIDADCSSDGVVG